VSVQHPANDKVRIVIVGHWIKRYSVLPVALSTQTPSKKADLQHRYRQIDVAGSSSRRADRPSASGRKLLFVPYGRLSPSEAASLLSSCFRSRDK
jgi:hypothetical protein